MTTRETLGPSAAFAANIVTDTPASAAKGEGPDLSTHDHPDSPDLTHVPHMERWAYNQMPKSGERDLRLMRYEGTDLYAWFGKVKGSVFEDLLCGPFVIKSLAQPHPSQQAMAEGALRVALLDARKTLAMLKRNVATEISRHDGLYRWEGVPEAIQARIEQCDAALTSEVKG